MCMNRQILRSSLILSVAGVLCKILGGFFRVPLTNILGTTGIGAFQMAISLFSFALILCSGGMTITISKLIAENHNNSEKCGKIVKKSIYLSVIIGLIIGLIFAVLCGKISYIQKVNETKITYLLMPILLPLGGIIACLRGRLQGLEKMFPTAVSQIIEQLFKFVLGLLFAKILIKYGIEWGVFGGFIGVLCSEISATIYLFSKSKFSVKNTEVDGFYSTLLPIYLASLIFPFITAFESLFIAKLLISAGISVKNSQILYGIESGVVGAMLNLPLILSTSIATATLPNLSKIKDREKFRKKTEEGFKILWFVLLPTVLGIMAVCEPVYRVLYPNLTEVERILAVNLTRFGGVATILTGIVQYIISVLEAKGKLFTILLLELAGGSVKILTLFLCTKQEINIYGLIIGRILMMGIICVLGLMMLQEIKCSWFDLFLPLLSSMVMFFGIEFLSQKINFSPIIKLLILVFIGIVIYFVLCIPILVEEFKKLRIFKQKSKV